MLQINHLNKTIGYVNETNQFISRRTKEHFFVKYKGFGLSLNIITKLRNMYVNEVIILFVRGDGTTSKYKTHIINFLKHGITHINLEHDYQKILPLTYFESD